MHARMGHVSFSPERADDMVSYAHNTIVPRYEQSDGFKGFTLLIDRAGGHGLGISFWENEEAMKLTEGLGDQARQGAAQAGSGQDQGVQHFEVAVDTMA